MYTELPREMDVEDYTFDAVAKAYEDYKENSRGHMVDKLRILIKAAQHAISEIEVNSTPWSPNIQNIEDAVKDLRAMCTTYDNAECILNLERNVKNDSEAGKLNYTGLIDAFRDVRDKQKVHLADFIEDLAKEVRETAALESGYKVEAAIESIRRNTHLYRTYHTNTEFLETMRDYKITK